MLLSASAHVEATNYLLPNLLTAVRLIMYSRFVRSDKSSLLISVSIVPGRMALARMPHLPSATAQLCISDKIPALVGV